MSDWQVIFLGVMAVSLVVMAVAQLVVAIACLRAAKNVSETLNKLQNDIRPVLDKVARIADDASRVTALALVQVERLDDLLKTSAARIDQTFTLVQTVVGGPIRQGSALVAALRAAFSIVRAWQNRPAAGSGTVDDEDPLFVG